MMQKTTTRLSIQDCVYQRPMLVTIHFQFKPLSFLTLIWCTKSILASTLDMYMNYFEINKNSFQFAKHVLDGTFEMLDETIAISLFAHLLMLALPAGHSFTCHVCMLTTH